MKTDARNADLLADIVRRNLTYCWLTGVLFWRPRLYAKGDWNEQHANAHRRDYTGKELSEPVVYPQGAPITNISIIDKDAGELHSIAGRDSEEFAVLETTQHQFRRMLEGGSDLSLLAEGYAKSVTDKRQARI